MRPLVLVAAVASVTALPGCWSEGTHGSGDPSNCYDFSCENRLTIYVERRDGDLFPPGEYTFSIDDDAIRVTCIIRPDGAVQTSGDTDELSIELNPAKDEFTLRLGGAPAGLSIEIERDGTIIGSEQLTPEYGVITSDDPDCLVSCLQGSRTVRVQAPTEES